MRALLLLICGAVMFSNVATTDEVATGLYNSQEDQDLIQLMTSENFYNVLEKDPPTLWLVEFYAHWCGHCQNYVKTWREVSKDLKSWEQYVRVGALDCGNTEYKDVCNENNITGFPTIKVIPSGWKAGDPSPPVLVDRTRDSVQAFVLKELMNQNKVTHAFKDLHTQSLEDLSTAVKKTIDDKRNMFIVLEPESSEDILGGFLIMNFVGLRNSVKESNLPQIFWTKGMMTEKESSLYQTFAAYGATDNYVIIFINGAKAEHEIILSQANRPELEAVKKLVFEIVRASSPISDNSALLDRKNTNDSAVEHINLDVSKQSPRKTSQPTRVHTQDLYMVVVLALRVEVAAHESFAKEDWWPLVEFVSLLRKYVAVSPKLDKSVKRLVENLEFHETNDAAVSRQDWNEMLDDAKFPLAPTTPTWTQCTGSQPWLRGYPCGLWVLMHTILAGATSQTTNNDHAAAEALEQCITFITTFFRCEHCVENFKKEIKALDTVLSGKEAYGSTALAFWRVHNSVNMRLGSDKEDASNDPEHPKVIFPSKSQCSACYTVDNSWNEEEVLKFLSKCYYTKGRFLEDELSKKREEERNQILLDQLKLKREQLLTNRIVRKKVAENLVETAAPRKYNFSSTATWLVLLCGVVINVVVALIYHNFYKDNHTRKKHRGLRTFRERRQALPLTEKDL
eukprot:m.187736 g.187736  ORF g.187736 m.187736 type:complete len:680 (+) comp15612_c0_seq11:206-2245(+)